MQRITLDNHLSLKPYTKSYSKSNAVLDYEMFGHDVPSLHRESFKKFQLENRDVIVDNIQIMSSAFQQEMFNQANLLLKNEQVITKLYSEQTEFIGIVLTNNLTIHYKIVTNLIDGKIHFDGSELYWFSQNVLVLKMTFIDGKIDKYFGNNTRNLKLNDAFNMILIKEPMHFFNRLYAVEVFKRFSNVETKVFNPIKDPKKRNNKQVNGTPFKFIELTSAYFTNLVVSGAFKVSGHWRLQPYKEGDFKLIWIKDFEKKGYTRKSVSTDIIDI